MQNSQGDAESLEQKIAQSAIDINAYDSRGFTLLHYAAQLGFDDSIYVLFKCGATLDQCTLVCLPLPVQCRITGLLPTWRLTLGFRTHPIF